MKPFNCLCARPGAIRQAIMPLVICDPLVAHPDDHVAKAATLLINRKSVVYL